MWQWTPGLAASRAASQETTLTGVTACETGALSSVPLSPPSGEQSAASSSPPHASPLPQRPARSPPSPTGASTAARGPETAQQSAALPRGADSQTPAHGSELPALPIIFSGGRQEQARQAPREPRERAPAAPDVRAAKRALRADRFSSTWSGGRAPSRAGKDGWGSAAAPRPAALVEGGASPRGSRILARRGSLNLASHAMPDKVWRL